MPKEKVIIIGLGEVGNALFELLKETKKFEVYGCDTDKQKMKAIDQKTVPQKITIMHICIPCSNKMDFIGAVKAMITRFKPKLTIINSTVPPNTTSTLYKECRTLVVHSPIRGVHQSQEHMKWELKRWIKYIGGATPEASKAAEQHFKKLGLKTKVVRSSLETELGKLFETTYRVWMITCFQEMHRISRHFKADFDDTIDFLEDTHRIRFDRPIMFPGVIGGHCLIPNLKLLIKNYDSQLLETALESNEKRKEEIENKSIQKELDKVKKRVEKLNRDLIHNQKE